MNRLPLPVCLATTSSVFDAVGTAHHCPHHCSPVSACCIQSRSALLTCSESAGTPTRTAESCTHMRTHTRRFGKGILIRKLSFTLPLHYTVLLRYYCDRVLLKPMREDGTCRCTFCYKQRQWNKMSRLVYVLQVILGSYPNLHTHTHKHTQ